MLAESRNSLIPRSERTLPISTAPATLNAANDIRVADFFNASPEDTTRGYGSAEFEAIADNIAGVLGGLKNKGETGNPAIGVDARNRVAALCVCFPICEG